MKKIAALITVFALTFTLTGCNYQLIDTTYHYDYAQIIMPDGTLIEGEVQAWTDYEGDQLQIKIDDVVYLTHASNVVLMHR